ncbi:Redoxin-domain-containing protein [Ascobolus immersus RN42]|uniref:Redoxin-domain-containing protein n=1 Tax=Ascobolus immersus RN42 TaxID=1160509 RepID=A0A3N4IB18_ASCIM|nr:Redoxin-domain-containing protein [Ascobolus immersus RN42]
MSSQRKQSIEEDGSTQESLLFAKDSICTMRFSFPIRQLSWSTEVAGSTRFFGANKYRALSREGAVLQRYFPLPTRSSLLTTTKLSTPHQHKHQHLRYFHASSSKMVVQAGDRLPDDIVLKYIPYTDDLKELTEVGVPEELNVSKEWANKKVALFAVPGAFTTGCSRTHLPGIISHLSELKQKGFDVVAVLAPNDPFVQSAWGRANKVFNNDILFLSDEDLKLAGAWDVILNGKRIRRFGIILDKGVVKHVGIDDKGVKNASAEALLAAAQ